MKIQDVRREFPALERQVFLDSACVSLAPQCAVSRLREFLDMVAFCPSGSSTQHHLDMDAMRSAARPEIARLIHANEADIALVESTTHGLSLVANSIPFKAGDRVLLCDLEFLEVAVPWTQKRDELGIAIDVVRNRDGRVLIEDIEAAIRPQTRVVAISSVQWSNGFRCDLDALSRLCRERADFPGRGCHPATGRDSARRHEDAGGRTRLWRSQVADGAVRLRLPLSQSGVSRWREAAAGGLSGGDRAGGRLGYVLPDAIHHAGTRLQVCRRRSPMGERWDIELSRRDRIGGVGWADQPRLASRPSASTSSTSPNISCAACGSRAFAW